MNTIGVLIAVLVAAVSLLVIFVCMAWLIEWFLDFWANRWEWIRTRMIRRMIFRARRAKLSGTELKKLNDDIDAINYIYWKYRLDESFDRTERQYVREVKKQKEFRVRG